MPWPQPGPFLSGIAPFPDNLPEIPKDQLRNMEQKMGTYPSPFPCQKTPKAIDQYCWVPHGPHQPISQTILAACINDATLQQHLHDGVIGVLLRPLKRFQNTVHHHCLVPKLIIQGSPRNPVMIPPILHHHKVNPLNNTPSEFIKLNLDGVLLPVDLTGSVPLSWSSCGNKCPFRRCNATSSVWRYGC